MRPRRNSTIPPIRADRIGVTQVLERRVEDVLDLARQPRRAKHDTLLRLPG
jgi:hypothetical protein